MRARLGSSGAVVLMICHGYKDSLVDRWCLGMSLSSGCSSAGRFRGSSSATLLPDALGGQSDRPGHQHCVVGHWGH